MNTPTIQILAEEGPLQIPFSAVQCYHGHAALAMLALMFQGQRGAFALLEATGISVERQHISIVSGHPGPGVRDAFECVTRAITRGCYTVDRDLPWARYGHQQDKSFSFILSHADTSVRGVLKEQVLPPQFFDLQQKSTGSTVRAEFAVLRRKICAEVLEQSPEALFDFSTPALIQEPHATS